jgi:hypothetical protein
MEGRNEMRETSGKIRVSGSGKEEIIYPLFGQHEYEVLYRIGYFTMHRYAGRYVRDLPEEVVKDAIQDAILELCEPGGLNALRDEAEAAGVPPAAVFARRVRNAFKREMRRCSLFRPEAIAIAFDDEEAKQYNILHHSSLPTIDSQLRYVELEEFMRKSLSIEEYTTAKMLMQGYTQREIAAKLRKGKRTIERYVNGIKSGFKTYNME